MISLKRRWCLVFLLKSAVISTLAVFFIMLSMNDSFGQQNDVSANENTVTFLSYSIGSPAFDKRNKALFEQVAQRTSYNVTFQSLPIKRYHLTLQDEKNSCSFNMTKTAENEKKFVWLRPSSVFLLYRYVTTDITEDQRNQPILVLRGSDIHRNMEKAGYNVEGVPSRDLIARMLLGERAYSWIDARIFVESYVAKDPELALVVDSVVFKGETWMVCSNKTDVEVREALKKQWDVALDKGSLAHIYSEAGYRELLLANKDNNRK